MYVCLLCVMYHEYVCMYVCTIIHVSQLAPKQPQNLHRGCLFHDEVLFFFSWEKDEFGNGEDAR